MELHTIGACVPVDDTILSLKFEKQKINVEFYIGRFKLVVRIYAFVAYTYDVLQRYIPPVQYNIPYITSG